MAEVVDWSPVDDDNDAAPPVGAPEGMMPSAVNNTMRAMMGSLRRMYDTVMDGSLILPYLSVFGGTVEGNVAITGTGGLTLSGVQLRNIGGGLLEVYHASSGGVAIRGPAAGYTYGDRDQTSAGWTWYATGGLSYLYNAATGNVLNVTNTGRMALAGAIDTPQHLISGILFAQRSSNAHVIYDSGGEVALALYGPASGNINYYQADTHQFQNNVGGVMAVFAAGTATATFTGTISINGAGLLAAISASISGTVQAGQLVSNGNVTAAGGSFIGNACSINNGVFANLDASDIDCAGNIDAASYTKSGVPVFLMTTAEHSEILARIEALETQLTQLRGMAHV